MKTQKLAVSRKSRGQMRRVAINRYGCMVCSKRFCRCLWFHDADATSAGPGPALAFPRHRSR